VPLDEGFKFENEIRQFLRDAGFSDVPPLHQESRREDFNLGGQDIDAFGRDGEFYVVVDAKTRSSFRRRRGRNVRNYLSVINGYKQEVTNDVRRRYEERYGFRDIVFVFWTKDIKIGEEDKRRAKDLQVALRDNFDLSYYNQALKLLGNKDIVRNGFLKDLSLQLPSLRVFSEGHSINAKAIRTKVGSKTLYTFPIEVVDLLKFAYVFRVEMNSILGESYQRLLKEKKIRKIRRYVELGGYFPNNLIVISETPLEFIPEPGERSDASFTLGELRLPNKPCYLEILDGQHRLYCYSNLRGRQSNCLWVTIIENLNSVERAKLFVTINKTQTPVPPSILWDLYQITDPVGIRGKISKFVYELNENGPLKDLISLPRIRSTRAYLSFPNLCSSFASRTNLFSRYGSEDSFMNVIKAFFEAISRDSRLQTDWRRSVKNKGRRGFICTNNSMSVLLRLLAKVLDKTGIPPRERITSWKGKLTEWIINPLAQYLDENRCDDREDPYKELRKLTSEKARKDAADKIWEKSPLFLPDADTSY